MKNKIKLISILASICMVLSFCSTSIYASTYSEQKCDKDVIELIDNIFEGKSQVIDNSGKNITIDFQKKYKTSRYNNDYKIISDAIEHLKMDIITLSADDPFSQTRIGYQNTVQNSYYWQIIVLGHVTKTKIFAQIKFESPSGRIVSYDRHLRASLVTAGMATTAGVETYPSWVIKYSNRVSYTERPYIKLYDGQIRLCNLKIELNVMATLGSQPNAVNQGVW